MPRNPPVYGFCPMGCGETLILGDGGHVTCSLLGCPRPSAADEILSERETEHTVVINEENFTTLHPLRERLDGQLLTCDIHMQIGECDGPPVDPGRYRVTRRRADGYSESYRSGPVAGLDFERIND